MLAIREHHVSTLAQQMGLRLVRAPNENKPPLYRLVEPHSMTPVLPGQSTRGSDLAELERWLQTQWQ